MRKLIAGLALVTLMGCSLKVVATNPRPNVNIPDSPKSLMLVLDPSIQDVFTIPEQNGVKKADVTGYHQTLKSGFENAFRDFYKLTDDKSSAELVLIVKRADPAFAPTSVSTSKNTEAAVETVTSQITFSAQLVNKTGNVVGRSANTAAAKKSITSPNEASKSIGEAVESMYEEIASDIFKTAQ